MKFNIVIFVILVTSNNYVYSNEDQISFLNKLNNAENYFDIFGYKKSDEIDKIELKKQYLEYARQYHPDVDNSETSQRIFYKINEAYSVLSDDQKRKHYEIELSKSDDIEEDPNNLNNIISSIFFPGMKMGGNQKRVSTPHKIRKDIELDKVINGGFIDIKVDTISPCLKCKGKGGDEKNIHICNVCNGNGYEEILRSYNNFFQISKTECNYCQGKGNVIDIYCEKCNGERIINEEKKHSIRVEPGIKNNEYIVLEGKGDKYPDTIRGDLVIQLVYNTNGYILDGLNITMKIDITFQESLQGFKKKIKYLDGDDIILKRNGMTEPNTIDIFKKRGIPDKSKYRGDLQIIYMVKYPKDRKELIDILNNILINEKNNYKSDL